MSINSSYFDTVPQLAFSKDGVTRTVPSNVGLPANKRLWTM